MSIEFSPGAILDIEDAALWYANEDAELAEDFVQKVRVAILDILVDPSRFPIDADSPRRKNVRMAILKRFPFKLLFIQRGQGVYVVSVSHTSRDSRHWRRRL